MANKALAIILAAGEGTRMKSARPKVLHEVGGRPMLAGVLAATLAAGFDRRAVVIGPGADAVRDFVAAADPAATCHVQRQRRGTAHAARAAGRAIAEGADEAVVLFGDTPLVTPATLKRIRRRLDRADIVVVGFRPADPGAYGRLIVERGRLVAIREAVEASAEERAIGLCNGGIMGFAGADLAAVLKRIGNDNPKGEYFLTDAVAIANRMGRRVVVVEVGPDEVLGVNSRADLAEAEAAFQRRARAKAMAGGATLMAPDTVWLSHDTVLARDVTVEPNVFFGPGVAVGRGARIRANSHLEGARVEAGATVGPFARLRPGAVVGASARIGNFVEVKNATIGEGAKANHLAYIGDADVGAAANIGAGAITCNYDGFDKFRTSIGEGAFIGANTSLVAPISIGKGAFVSTGSVATSDVAADDMAVARARQVTKKGWARRFRDKRGGGKKIATKKR